jgi:3-oxoadipate enol-lactonase
MPFASSASAKLSYNVRGQGPDTVLLIMGLGGHASEWGEPFLEPLSAKYRVVTMDNRGIGESHSDLETWTMHDMALDACAVLDAVGAASAHVIGTSMGGMISQQLACDMPDRVQKLVLMATTFGGREALPPAPEAAAVLLPVPGFSIAELQRRTLRVLTAPGFATAHPELIEQLAQLRERMPTRGRVFKAQFGCIVASDRSQSVRGLRAPTLVVHGQDDPLIPVENGKLLAERIPAQRFVLLDDCGHFPHVEKPIESVTAVLEFLAL